MATTTITGLTAVLAANLTDAARIPVDDANGNTRKATLAQLRTALASAAWSFAASVAVATTLAVAGMASLSGGVLVGPAGSATVTAVGANTDLRLSAAGTGYLLFNESGAERARIAGGVLAIGSTTTGGAVAGDMVIGHTRALRSVNSAGTGTHRLINGGIVGSINVVSVAIDGQVVGISNPNFLGLLGAGDVGIGAELVIANNRGLRGVNALGTGTLPMIYLDTSNHTSVALNGANFTMTGGPAVAGAAGALIGYIPMNYGGTSGKVPFYAT